MCCLNSSNFDERFFFAFFTKLKCVEWDCYHRWRISRREQNSATSLNANSYVQVLYRFRFLYRVRFLYKVLKSLMYQTTDIYGICSTSSITFFLVSYISLITFVVEEKTNNEQNSGWFFFSSTFSFFFVTSTSCIIAAIVLLRSVKQPSLWELLSKLKAQQPPRPPISASTSWRPCTTWVKGSSKTRLNWFLA